MGKITIPDNVLKKGTTHDFSYDNDSVFEAIKKFARLQVEYKEQALAEIITKYDFVVGSAECKHRLMQVLPEANVICCPYIEDPTMIYAIKKFDTEGWWIEPQESEVEE